jgi:hypothetical protein
VRPPPPGECPSELSRQGPEAGCSGGRGRCPTRVRVKNGPPPIDPGPKQARWINAHDVPIWFVSTVAYDAINADGRVTIAELLSLDPLIGPATFFSEVLHLRPPSPGFQHHSVVARGALEDGREFCLRILRTLGEQHLEVGLGA